MSDMYKQYASELFKVKYDEVTEEQRSFTKRLLLTTTYGGRAMKQFDTGDHAVKVKLRGTCGICGEFDINMARRFSGGRYFNEMCGKCHKKYFPNAWKNKNEELAKGYRIQDTLVKVNDHHCSEYFINLSQRGKYDRIINGMYEFDITDTYRSLFPDTLKYHTHVLVSLNPHKVAMIGYNNKDES